MYYNLGGDSGSSIINHICVRYDNQVCWGFKFGALPVVGQDRCYRLFGISRCTWILAYLIPPRGFTQVLFHVIVAVREPTQADFFLSVWIMKQASCQNLGACLVSNIAYYLSIGNECGLVFKRSNQFNGKSDINRLLSIASRSDGTYISSSASIYKSSKLSPWHDWLAFRIAMFQLAQD